MEPARQIIGGVRQDESVYGALLDRLDATLYSATSTDDVVDALVRLGMDGLGVDAGVVGIYDGNSLLVQRTYGDSGLRVGMRLSPDRFHILRLALESRDVVASSDALRDPSLNRETMRAMGISSVIFVPFAAGGRLFGGMWLCARGSPVRFDESAVKFARRFGLRVGLTLQNHRLTEMLQDELAKSHLLQDVATCVAAATDMGEAAQDVLRLLAESLGMRAGTVRTLTDSGDLTIIADTLPEEASTHIHEDRDGTSKEWLGSRAFSERRTLTQEDEVVDPAREAAIDRGGVRALLEGSRYVAMPLLEGSEPIGTMTLVFTGRRPFKRHETAFFESVAATLSQGLKALRLLDSETRTKMRLAQELEISNLLLEAAEAIAAPLAPDQVLETLADICERLTGRLRVVICTLEDDYDGVITAVGRRTIKPPGARTSFAELPSAYRRCIQDNRSTVVDTTDPAMNREDVELAEAFRGKLLLLVPLTDGERVIGLLIVDTPGRAVPFSARDKRLVEGVAAQASIAMRNAKHYEREHNIAETLQERLLVLPQTVAGVDYASVYRSATIAARVGGDFIDLFELRGNRVGVAIGDVSGKGLEAATITAMVRNTLRAHAVDGLPPASIAEKTSEAVRQFTTPETFVTLFFGVLDTRSGMLTYVNAGHPKPVALRREGGCEMLVNSGPILGAFCDTRYREGACILGPSDTLVLYTDGLTEARRGAELYGEARLLKLLDRLPYNEPKDVLDILFGDMRSFSGDMLRDDLAMLAVRPKVRGPGVAAGQVALDI